MSKTIKKQVPWVRPLYEAFVRDAGLTDEDASILEKKVFEDWTWVKLCDEFHIGRTTLRNKLRTIMERYDYLNKIDPEHYPKQNSNR